MAKVTAQLVKDSGFRPEQFGTPGGATGAIVTGASFDAYLAPVLEEAELWARSVVGDTAYDGAGPTTAAGLRLRNAELCYVKAILWRRRMAFVDSNAQAGLDGNSSEYLNRRELEAHAAAADECAARWMQQFLDGGPLLQDAGVQAGHVTTGPYLPAPRVPGAPC